MVGGVDDASGARRRLDDVDVLDVPVDLPEDRIERVLERAVDRVALPRAQLVEVREDALTRLQLALAVDYTTRSDWSCWS
jgi:hypothetical protein